MQRKKLRSWMVTFKLHTFYTRVASNWLIIDLVPAWTVIYVTWWFSNIQVPPIYFRYKDCVSHESDTVAHLFNCVFAFSFLSWSWNHLLCLQKLYSAFSFFSIPNSSPAFCRLGKGFSSMDHQVSLTHNNWFLVRMPLSSHGSTRGLLSTREA